MDGATEIHSLYTSSNAKATEHAAMITEEFHFSPYCRQDFGILNRLTANVTANDILPESHGFRAGNRTCDMIFIMR